MKPVAMPVFLKQVPAQVRSFLVKALVLFVAWKLVYHLVLFPIRFPDRPLTLATAKSAAFLYTHLMGETMILTDERISNEGIPYIAVHTAGHKLVAIADSCNGLELIVLFVGFLCCFPPNIKRQLPYIIAGTIAIVIANAFRCYGLTWMYMNNYYLADFFHKYLFKMAIYGMIFTIWVRYSKRYFHV
jgi:exosortase/archaeosortase family protein